MKFPATGFEEGFKTANKTVVIIIIIIIMAVKTDIF